MSLNEKDLMLLLWALDMLEAQLLTLGNECDANIKDINALSAKIQAMKKALRT